MKVAICAACSIALALAGFFGIRHYLRSAEYDRLLREYYDIHSQGMKGLQAELAARYPSYIDLKRASEEHEKAPRPAPPADPLDQEAAYRAKRDAEIDAGMRAAIKDSVAAYERRQEELERMREIRKRMAELGKAPPSD